MSEKASRFLIIRLSSMGDVALTMPVLDRLWADYGPGSADYVTKKAFKPLIAYHPAVRTVFCPGHKTSLYKLRRIIRKKKYTKILDLHKNFRSLVLTLGFCHVHRIQKKIFKRFLLSKFKFYRPPYLHVTQKYLNVLTSITEALPTSSLCLPPEESIHEKNKTIYTRLKRCSKTLLLAPGASKPSKMLPMKTWETVLESMHNEFDMILIIGNGKPESEWAEKIAQDPNQGYIINMTGRLALHELMLFIAAGTLFAGNDSGPAHLAALAGRPTVVIFGQTVPEYGFSPLNFPSVIEPPVHLVCRPCSHLGYVECPQKHHLCMKSIDAQTLINEMRNRLPENDT